MLARNGGEENDMKGKLGSKAKKHACDAKAVPITVHGNDSKTSVAIRVAVTACGVQYNR